ALWAQRVYDNEMRDTPIFDYGEDGRPGTGDVGENDGVLDTGDGWFGEDVGLDGLYAETEGDTVFYFGELRGIYPGPDEGERDGVLQPGEDALLWNLQTITSDSGLVYAGPKFSRGLREDWQIGHLGNNHLLDLGDGIPDFQGPPPPPSPFLHYELTDNEVILRWSHEAELFVDPFSRIADFEGYRIWVGNSNMEDEYTLIGDYDLMDYAYFTPDGRIMTRPSSAWLGDLPPDSLGTDWQLRPVSVNNGLSSLVHPHGSCEPWSDDDANGYWNPGESFTDTDGNGRYDWGADYTRYEYVFPNARPLFPRYYSVTCYDFGDYQTGTQPLESAKSSNALYLAPGGRPGREVRVVPNPYRATEDYRHSYEYKNSQTGLSWENQDDGTQDFYPQYDRRLEFINLPQKALIRIYTIAGDLVQIVPHNLGGDRNLHWKSDYSESWDLNSRNNQQVVSGLYFFSVEDKTRGESYGEISTGKFVIIR
ncbi:MAG: hypothetical protein V2A34_11745, partial [Lentisphaerota bacterium]